MPSSHRTRSKISRPVRSEPAAAEVLAWLSDCIHGGLCFVCQGLLIFENSQFAELVESVPPQEGGESALRKRLLDDAIVWNQRDLGSRKSVEYQLVGHDGRALYYACRFNVVPYRGECGVLMVLEDVTERVLLAQDASQVARFQSVLARIGTLGVSGISAQELMNDAVKETAAALEVELCKILVPREPDGHLYIMAGSGLRDELIGKLTIEGGTHSQAGYAIRERVPVVVEDLRWETRFSASKLLTEHGAVAGMCVPMLVEDRVYGVMTAHSKRVRRFTQKEQEFVFVHEIRVVVVNLQPIQFVGRPIVFFFDVREKEVATAGFDQADVIVTRFEAFADVRLNDGLLRIRQKAFAFRAGDKKHAVAHTAPTVIDEILWRTHVIRQQDDLHAGAFGGGQQFWPRAAGVSGIFRVRVQDGFDVL